MGNKKGLLSSLKNRGVGAWLISLLMISFYVFLYWDKKIDRFIFDSKLTSINQKIESLPPQEPKAIQLQQQKKNIIKSAFRWYSKKYPKGLDEKYYPLLDDMRNGFSATKTMSLLVAGVNPISYLIRRKKADRWFLYSFLYTLLVVLMGFRFLSRWKDEKYQRVRTLSVMLVQFIIAFMIPGLLEAFHQKAFYFNYFWPLKIEYLFPSTLNALPRGMALWAIMMAFVGVPILTYFFGKRWYCSWVCGCGALANTLGDPWRHLSSKTRLSWRLEMTTIYSVLVIAILMTGIVIYNHYRGDVHDIRDGFSDFAFQVQDWYGFLITAGFAGVIGTGFYPIGGTRVWCRFGCPQAAILGIIQKFFSRFRITVNGDQCMSCGNCSTYCEMGIDVRSYAMQGKDIVRASCVGCGICMSVCPRGVLKLETGKVGVELG